MIFKRFTHFRHRATAWGLALAAGCTFLLSETATAQRWKYERYEFSFGVGMSNFLGDLGGANQVGTHYFKDYEFSQTKLAFALGIRYKLSRFFALKTHFTYGQISGDDKLTEEFFRNYRNLSFNSDIWEWNLNFEGAFQEEQAGHRYNYKRVRGYRTYELYMYAFAGVGFFYFNPKTTLDGKVYDLHSYRTEGQGVVPGRKQYSLFQPCIPVGVGFKYTINRKWGVGLEFGVRKTFTDYLDDVSTTYFDVNYYTDKLKALGVDPTITAALSDRSDHSQPWITGTFGGDTELVGQERGDPRYKDTYMFAIFSLCYKIKNTRSNLPLF